MLRYVLGKLGFVLAHIAVMIVLHGNSRQFWPRIPYLSLRNESIAEHTRLLFNTQLVVTIAQALLGRLPPERRLPRAIVLVALPLALPLLILFGQKVLRLEGPAAERYYLALVPVLPAGAVVVEELLVRRAQVPG